MVLAGVMDALNSTGYRLFLASGDEPNLAMSPLSIGLAFGMLHAGASGRVREAIERLYSFPPDAPAALERLVTQVSRDGESLPTVTVANGAFIADEFTLLADYAATLREHFAAFIEPLPMRTDPEGSRAAIDAWISDQTRGLIEHIIPEDQPHEDTRLILVNTVYFKAQWEQPFSEGGTSSRPFTLADGTESSAELMFKGGGFEFARGDAWEAVRLPYKGELEMLVVIPAAGRFAEVHELLSGSLIDDVDAALTPGQVLVGLPKFTAEAKVDLEEIIARGLGIQDLFGVEGLDGIGPRLAVDAAIHAAKVIVDEEGTEAAAATVIAVRAMSMPVYDAEIIADRPFLYVIRDTATKTVLFIGRFTDPTA